MSTWIFGLLALLVSGALAVASLHLCVAVMVALVSSSKSLPAGALVGCWPWIGATALSTFCCMLLYGRLGYAALVAAPAGLLVVSLMEAIRLRTAGGGEVQRAFRFEAGRIVHAETGEMLEPKLAVWDSDYAATGPASGYVVHRIELRRGETVLAVNTYLEKAEGEADAGRLEKEFSIPVDRPADK